jgi:5'-3' exonuclease
MLLDSASLYFRAFHGVPESVAAPDGSPVNAVRGFLDMIATLVRTRRPTRLVACMDASWRPAFRVSAVPSYKSHRLAPNGREEIVPAALVPQVPVIEQVLDALGVATIGVAGFEADDVIGTLADAARGPVEVVSGDRDLFQVVRDDRPVRVLYIGRGVSKLEVVDEAWLRAKYGISGTHGGQGAGGAYADFAALRGDPSDGLPGVPGVGEKTAAALVERFGSLAGIEAALDEGIADGFPSGSRTRLAAARDYLAVAPLVVRVRRDVPVPDHDDTLPAGPAEPDRLVELSGRWGLDSSLNRVLSAFTAAHAE